MTTVQDIMDKFKPEWNVPEKIRRINLGDENYDVVSNNKYGLSVISYNKNVAVTVNRERHMVTILKNMGNGKVGATIWVPNGPDMKAIEETFPIEETWLSSYHPF